MNLCYLSSALFLQLFVVFTLLLPDTQQAGSLWNYADKGPAAWPTLFKRWCSGRHQSPIKLKVSESYRDDTLDTYTFAEPTVTNTTPPFTLKNDGHKAEVLFNTHQVNVSLSSHQRECFRPVGIHFHWGSVNNKGSEHWLEEKQYPMEGHIVMWDCRFWDSFGDAAMGIDGLAVLGIFFEVDPAMNNSAPHKLSAITDKLPSVLRCDDCFNNASGYVTTPVKAFPIVDLLPANRKDVFVYSGGLTTPDCRENVLWTVFNEPIKIPQSAMDAFRSLQFPRNVNGTAPAQPMVNNYRPPLPLNPLDPVGSRRVLSRSFGPANPNFIPGTTTTASPKSASKNSFSSFIFYFLVGVLFKVLF